MPSVPLPLPHITPSLHHRPLSYTGWLVFCCLPDGHLQPGDEFGLHVRQTRRIRTRNNPQTVPSVLTSRGQPWMVSCIVSHEVPAGSRWVTDPQGHCAPCPAFQVPHFLCPTVILGMDPKGIASTQCIHQDQKRLARESTQSGWVSLFTVTG